ncbi:MAG: hypothetical protein JXO72_09010 [Vicinamibacteria bacterium]|nr:hypothetical protein [Vicinamibacteria bacterium]
MDVHRSACLSLIVVLLASSSFPEEYKFDLAEIEKKPYDIGGYAELRPSVSLQDVNAAFYKLRYFDHEQRTLLEDYNGKLQLEGSYEIGPARLFVRTNADLRYSHLGWEHGEAERMIHEGYVLLRSSDSLHFKVGKQTLLWGKGYAFNPVAFVGRPKDPGDPDLALEGFYAASADLIMSCGGPLKTVAVTPVVFPVFAHVNDDFGKAGRVNFAGKIYFLLFDTDIDLIGFAGGSRTSRFGIDFSRNIQPNFEIHGEVALIGHHVTKAIDVFGNVSESQSNATSYLLGIRYLTPWDATIICEYYRNGTGLNRHEMNDYYMLIDKGHDLFLATGDSSLLDKAADFSEGNYGRVNPMTDYLYLRITQKEPWNILYFTPAVAGMMNLNDKSLSITPELLYAGITNLELRLRAAALVGRNGSDYGERPNDFRVELRMRCYF